ncbi:MAG: autotransporter domain-containing protein, partial [Alphaproteobacteria bacterium]|nr:autotransporter domain-containing protein [Alphaproteobacteria bacterium]
MLKKTSFILLSSTILAGIAFSSASMADTLADTIDAFNKSTEPTGGYEVPSSGIVTTEKDSGESLATGPVVERGDFTIDGEANPTATIKGSVGVRSSNPSSDRAELYVYKVGDGFQVSDDYAVTSEGGWTNLTSSSVTSNYAAASVSEGDLTIQSSSFSGSKNSWSIDNADANATAGSGNNGGAIYVGANGNLNIGSSLFHNNDSEMYGGAIDLDHVSAKIGKITNTYFIENTAGLHGGALDVHGEVVDIKNSHFVKNVSPLGGAIYIHDGAVIKNIENTNFQENKAGVGGAIYQFADATEATVIKDSTFKNNQAVGTTDSKDGAGSAIRVGGNLQTENVTFSGNKVITGTAAGSTVLGGTVYVDTNGTYASTGDTFDGNTSVADGGAIYNAGTTTLTNTTIENNKATGNGGAVYNAGQLKITGTTTMSGNVAKIGSNLYNTDAGTVNIEDVHDNVDLDYNPFTVTTAPSSSRTLFDQKGDIYNAGTMNITNSDLQLHNGINTNTALTETAKKVGTVNIANSRIDLGGSGVAGDGTIYADTVNIKAGSKIQTHVSTNASGSHGKISANDITVSADNTSLGIIVGVGELAAGEKREYEVLDAKNGVSGEFENIANNKLYDIAAKGDGVYEISRKKEFCPDGNCDPNESATAKGWIDGTAITGNEVATNIQDKLNTLWQSDGCSDEVKTALDGLAPDVSPLIQAHATEITRRLSAVISERFYNSMERTGYVHRGKRFYRFPRHDSNLWVQGLYGKSKYDVRKGWDMDTKGIAVGFDGHVTDALRMGVSYAYTKADGDSVGRETTIDSHTGTIYGEYNPNRYYANWLAMYTRSEYDEEKKVFDHRVSANYDVDAIGAQVMLGRKMGPYVQEDWASGVIKPEIGMRYLYTKQHEYTDSVGQKVGSADGHTLTGILGAQYTIGYTLSPTLSWYPELRAALTYDFIEPDTSMRVNLLNGSTYTVKTENMDRLGIEVGARVGLDINRKAEISLEYEGLFKGD